MTGAVRRARSPWIAAVVTGAAVLASAGCGAGGFSSTPAPTRSTKIMNYVAMGDGFAAGPYTGTTTSKDGCLRSAANYPTQVATALQVKAFTDVSCVGAVTRSITHVFTTRGTKQTVQRQLDAVTKDTDLVTIGIGIEDAHAIPDMFRICPAEPCGTDIAGKRFVDQDAAFKISLPRAIRAIQDRAPNAFILVVGYPQLAPAAGGCAGLPKMDKTQLEYANYVLETYINSTMQQASRQTGAVYVDVANLDGDHNVCSKDPWMTGKTGVPGKSLPFHPVLAEQTAVAKAITNLVRNR